MKEIATKHENYDSFANADWIALDEILRQAVNRLFYSIHILIRTMQKLFHKKNINATKHTNDQYWVLIMVSSHYVDHF